MTGAQRTRNGSAGATGNGSAGGAGRPGRHALFGEPVAPAGDVASGRRAFFTPPAARPRAGTVVVGCSACGGRRAVGLLHLGRLITPSLWLPWRRHSRLMRCPSCDRVAWCALDWSGFSPLR